MLTESSVVSMMTRVFADTLLGHMYTFDPMAAILLNMFVGVESLATEMEVMVSPGEFRNERAAISRDDDATRSAWLRA